MLAATFPEYEIETFTLSQMLKHRFDILLVNMLFALRDNGFSILKSKNALRKAFMTTPYLFSFIKRLIAKIILPNRSDYVFSIQLQSLFDLSVPDLPHYIYTDHTHLANLTYADFNPEDLRSSKWVSLERQIYQNAAHIFTRSTNISESLVENYNVDPGKTTCAFVGVNTTITPNQLDNQNYANKNILFVGFDWERKVGPDLVSAFEKVLKVHPDAKLSIVGPNPQVDHPNIQVYGRLPLEDLHKHYKSASLFCLPTHLEPFGVVFVEAMSYGLPIIATQIGAIPDFVLEEINGYLVAPGDVDGLAERIIAVIGNPDLLRTFGGRSRQLAADRYNWECVGEIIRKQILADLNMHISEIGSSNGITRSTFV